LRHKNGKENGRTNGKAGKEIDFMKNVA